MDLIKVWCEYDIGGEFGGNNNEDVLDISDVPCGKIDSAVLDYLCRATSAEPDDLEDLYGWEKITPIKLGV